MSIIAEIKTSDGRVIGTMALPEKVFKTGSRGYYAVARRAAPLQSDQLRFSHCNTATTTRWED